MTTATISGIETAPRRRVSTQPTASNNWLVALGGKRVRALFDATAPLAAARLPSAKKG